MSGASYDGPAINGAGQHISEAPHWQGDGETVDVVDSELDANGEQRTEGIPELSDGPDRPDEPGQSTFADWGWSQ